jgi:hypothetical protein
MCAREAKPFPELPSTRAISRRTALQERTQGGEAVRTEGDAVGNEAPPKADRHEDAQRFPDSEEGAVDSGGIEAVEVTLVQSVGCPSHGLAVPGEDGSEAPRGGVCRDTPELGWMRRTEREGAAEVADFGAELGLAPAQSGDGALRVEEVGRESPGG